jgi:hypothetical protein
LKISTPSGREFLRRFLIPAVPFREPDVDTDGVEMISVPWEFTDTDPEHVFQSLGGLDQGAAGSLYRWNPEKVNPGAPLFKYVQYDPITPDPFLSEIEVGAGYWLYNSTETNLIFPGDASALPTDEAVRIILREGWNQIGNPFPYTLYLRDVTIVDKLLRIMSFREAGNRRILQPTAFRYDTETQQYDWASTVETSLLNPYEGFWVYANEEVTAIIPHPSMAVPQSTDSGPAPQGTGWLTDLVLSGPNVPEFKRVIGLNSLADSDLDACDVLAPPTVSNGQVKMHLVAPQRAEACMVDVQGLEGGRKDWYLRIHEGEAGQELSLAWPDLSTVPSDYSLVLEDLATGARMYMRTTARYRFTLSESGSRMLKVSLLPAGDVTPLVSQLQANEAGAGVYSLSYSLSAPASVDVKITNISGVPISQVASGEVQAAGTNTITWNGRSDGGTKVPPGRYLATVTVRSPESGQESTAIITLDVGR